MRINSNNAYFVCRYTWYDEHSVATIADCFPIYIGKNGYIDYDVCSGFAKYFERKINDLSPCIFEHMCKGYIVIEAVQIIDNNICIDTSTYNEELVSLAHKFGLLDKYCEYDNFVSTHNMSFIFKNLHHDSRFDFLTRFFRQLIDHHVTK